MKPVIPALLLAAAFPVAAQQPGSDMPSPSQMFMQQMDANQDGAVTLEEFQQPTNEQFKYMDKNGDGRVTADEAEAFHAEMQQRMQQQMQQMQQQGGGQHGQPSGYPQHRSGQGTPQRGSYGQYPQQ